MAKRKIESCPNSFEGDGIDDYEEAFCKGWERGHEKGRAQGFLEGWDGCMRALCKMPLDKALRELAKYAKKMFDEKNK